ncbi:hypothetical protein BY996DRAFT_8688093 [Phakopsora pachyrhizi]|nr:hypothetical protein BY996DRAFT_8688093 [Phakopsora pachyrhizi]
MIIKGNWYSRPMIITGNWYRRPMIITGNWYRRPMIIIGNWYRRPMIITGNWYRRPMIITGNWYRRPMIITGNWYRRPMIITGNWYRRPMIIIGNWYRRPMIITGNWYRRPMIIIGIRSLIGVEISLKVEEIFRVEIGSVLIETFEVDGGVGRGWTKGLLDIDGRSEKNCKAMRNCQFKGSVENKTRGISMRDIDKASKSLRVDEQWTLSE